MFLGKVWGAWLRHNGTALLWDRISGLLENMVGPGFFAFLPLKPVHFPGRQGGDSSDLAIFKIRPGSVSTAQLASNTFLDLNPYRCKPFALQKSSILALVGYPAEINSISYDDYQIRTEGYSVDGRYDGPGEEIDCSKIRFNNVQKLGNIDGLSGSPILQFTPTGEKTYKHRFAGMLIRGTKASGEGRFINAPAIYRALEGVQAS